MRSNHVFFDFFPAGLGFAAFALDLCSFGGGEAGGGSGGGLDGLVGTRRELWLSWSCVSAASDAALEDAWL